MIRLYCYNRFFFFPLRYWNHDRCTRDRRHVCAPALSGFCRARCRHTTQPGRPARKYCSRTVIVNPIRGPHSPTTVRKRNEKQSKISYQRADWIDIGRKTYRHKHTHPTHTLTFKMNKTRIEPANAKQTKECYSPPRLFFSIHTLIKFLSSSPNVLTKK